MGTIKADTLTGLSTASDVTIASNKFVGTASGTMTVVGEGGTTQTNLQHGLAKMWHRSADDATPTDSLNVSGGTDNGTGDYTYAFTNSMGNANFGQAHIINDTNAGSITSSEQATGSTRIEIINGDGSAARDRINAGQVHGDLA